MKGINGVIATVITWLIILCAILCLLGCAKKTPVENAFDDVNQAIISTKESLPAQCKTEIVLSKFEEIEAKRQVAQNTCEMKIKDVQTKYERVLGVLIVLILGIFVKIFIKK